MTNDRLWGCAFWVVAAVILGWLLWYLYRPSPLPAAVDPTPTMLAIVTDPTRPTASPPAHTPTPPEPILTTPSSTPVPTSTATPTATDTPTSTPSPVETRAPVQKG